MAVGKQPTILTPENITTLTADFPFYAKMAVRALTHLAYGALTLRLPDGSAFHFQSPGEGPHAELILNNWRLPRRALLGGTVGVAESYIDGDWDSPDVTSFLSLFIHNEQLGEELSTANWLNNAFEKLRHWFNNNTRTGSKRNIAAHYDLGNNFYSKWLDASMTYSSAVFEDGANSLTAAQIAKYRSLAQRSDIRENHTVLEIGSGWGGFAEYAAREIGCRITGLTISQEQFEFARERIFRQGLNEKVEIKLQDYRDERNIYDRIASIEMFEAVGEKYWPVYFNKLCDCLKWGGMAGLQIITIADRGYHYYRKHPDFIQRYIFPGGMLPTPAILNSLSYEAGMKKLSERIFPEDYARTLSTWRSHFLDAWQGIRPLGFDERFKRMWTFYLHYCEAGFRSGHIDVRQIFYQKA
jgi:cyclopropane-fatty-acyl-phospholipid synthase